MITRLEVPKALQRNAPDVAALGYERTGHALINLVTRLVGLDDLANADILDVGCGVRFTMTIINRGIRVKSYTGVEVHRPIVEFLQEHVEAHDTRFKFVHWDVHHRMYNPAGVELKTQGGLLLGSAFDLIWLFSVFTHLNPEDSFAMLQVLRRHIRKNGKLFFSAFIDDELDGFVDRHADQPLLTAYYGRKFLRALVEQAGWKVEAFHDKDPGNYIQHHLVCSPTCD